MLSRAAAALLLLSSCGGLAPALGEAVALPMYSTAADLRSNLGPPCEVEDLGGGQEAWYYCAKPCEGQWCRSTCEGPCPGRWRFLLLSGVIINTTDLMP